MTRGSHARIAISLAMWMTGCGDRSPAATVVEVAALEPAAVRRDDDRVRRRDDARLVLERHCGACHVSAYDGALPGALAVYDLLEEEWAVRATDAQLRDIVFRLGEPLGPDAEPLNATPEERGLVERYVEAEIARRAGGPS